jgi:hypothetical protein
MDTKVEDEEDWASLSDIARLRGITPQAVWKRVRSFELRGQLSTRRRGRAKLIHLPSFDALAAATHDPAQELRNRNVRRRARSPTSLPIESPPEPSKFNDAAAREKNAKAELAEIQLAQKRGELVPVREIEAATIEAGTKITQRLNAMKAQTGRLYAAAKGGEEALHIELLALVDATIAAIGEEMMQIAANGNVADEATKTH